jgi:Flp pilus assembly pilin Flp
MTFVSPVELIRSTRGATMIEFALVAPILLLMLIGGLEIGHTMYVRSALIGSLQKAARDLSLEGANSSTRQNAIADSVSATVRQIMPSAQVSLSARSFHDYRYVALSGEEYNDANHNGRCDNGEAYVDGNRNGTWDIDGSVAGRGGAKDVVLLEATVRYDRIGPAGLLTGTPKTVLTAKTLIRNQPYDQQADPPTRLCS